MKVNVKHTHIEITDYNKGDCERLEKYLSVWDESIFSYVPMGYYYDEDKKILKIPRGVNTNYVEKLLGVICRKDIKHDNIKKIELNSTGTPRNELQQDAINFVMGNKKYNYVKKYSQVFVNLNPGEGKTFIGTTTICMKKLVTMIVIHTEKIKNQWIESLLKFTDINEEDICIINGSNGINNLLENKDNRYKVYIVNHKTFTSYGSKCGWDFLSKLTNHLGIGYKIIDEVHLNFANTINIDLNCNIKYNLYLTATAARTDMKEDRLFNIFFSNSVRYVDINSIHKRHVVYLGLRYNSRPSEEIQASMQTYKGFSQVRYADYLEECPKLYDTLSYLLNKIKDTEGRILILSTKISTSEKIRDFVKDFYDNKTVSTYHSKLDDREKEKALESDIICSTLKSAGTGFDLNGLRVLICTEPYSSSVTAKQISGRLRPYEDKDTLYVEIIDTGFKAVYRMYKERLKTFKLICKKMLNLDMNKIKEDE
jgi:superfamily II DNA or RNA helicase